MVKGNKNKQKMHMSKYAISSLLGEMIPTRHIFMTNSEF